MPKLGMEPVRRAALVQATVAEIGAAGSLDVTVSQIAKRAGMSTALAHHYFGGKDQIFLAAMRHILRDYGTEVRRALAECAIPQDRLAALIRANFAPSCFHPATTAAWLQFYVYAQTDPAARRLLRIYHLRLRSNLTHALRVHSDFPETLAETLGAQIDGVYLRAVLGARSLDRGADDVLACARALIKGMT